MPDQKRKIKFARAKSLLSKRGQSTKLAKSDQEGVPRITSDTVAEHREQILSGARRFIYPLQQAKHKVLIKTGLILVSVMLLVLMMTGVMLYRYQSTSNFAYQVSQIVPFPVAKVNGQFVSYEDYLFELRYSLFYFRNFNQEGVDIESTEGQDLVVELKRQALEKVKIDAIASQLAEGQEIEITKADIDRQIEAIRKQGGIGDSDESLNETLRSTYNWGVGDLKKAVRSQLIRQALPRALDVDTINKANEALAKITNGSKFGKIAEKYSDDLLTKDNDGLIGTISKTNTDLPAEFVDAVFRLEEGEVSDLVSSRFGLHIIKVNKIDGDERNVSHILFNYFDIDQYLQEELEKVEVIDYIKIPEARTQTQQEG